MTKGSRLRLFVRGARGSMSVSGSEYHRFGGNTTCFHVPLSPNEHLIIDAGSGLRDVERSLGPGPHHFTFVFTHYHWDHIQGLPVFAPIYDPANSFTFVGPSSLEHDVEEALCSAIREPWFPVNLATAPASTTYREIKRTLRKGPIAIHAARLHHPQGVAGYRIEGPTRSVVIATDHEAGDRSADRSLLRLMTGADHLIHDGQYTTAEYLELRRGWGHSTPDAAVDAALAGGVSRLILTSHDPDHDDSMIDAMVAGARARFPMTTAAYEGLEIVL